MIRSGLDDTEAALAPSGGPTPPLAPRSTRVLLARGRARAYPGVVFETWPPLSEHGVKIYKSGI